MLFWTSCILAGLSLCLAMRVITGPLSRHSPPIETDKGRLLLRLSWPWVNALAPACNLLLSWRQRQSLARRMQVAGIEPSYRPEHIFAMQVLAALALAVLTALFLHWCFSPGFLKSVVYSLPIALAGFGWPLYWLREQGAARQRHMLQELPFLLDMTTLCVEAGLNLQGALQQAAHHGPVGPLRHELRHALADMRAGMPRLEAMHRMAARTGLPPLRQLATSLGQADQLGMSLGPLLRAQAEQRRSERFLRAEKLALEAPVKMLFPMVFCIFPCTFLIIGFPLAIKLLGAQW